MTTQFECFIAASVRQVRLCRRYSIHPIDFFEMQVRDDDHWEFQSQTRDHLGSLVRNACIGPAVADNPKRVKLTGDRRQDFRSDEHQTALTAFDYTCYVDDFLDGYERDIEPLFKEYAENIHATQKGDRNMKFPTGSTDKPAIIFCFDEAHALLEPSKLAFLALRRALRHRSRWEPGSVETSIDERFFCVLLDTCAKFNLFVPPRGLDPSAKLVVDPREQFSPIWKINSFDVLAKGPHTIDKLERVIDPERLFTLGRPNWAAQLNCNGLAYLKRNAFRKMYGGGPRGIFSEMILTSMLSFRLQFYILSHHLAETLVSGYLRMVYSISGDRLVMRTIQPSEPILAWVSSLEMQLWSNCRSQVVENFYKQCTVGSIDTGDIGEMVAALILMFSFDKKQRTDVNGPIPQTLYEFLASLFGDHVVSSAGLGSNETGERMVWLMMNGFVFFNHFVRLEGPVNDTVLRQAWGRGTALFTYPGTAYFDIIIPVAIPDDNEMSYIIIQVKNRQGDQLTKGLENEANFDIFNAAKSNTLPNTKACLGILMALRSGGNQGVKFDAGYSESKKTRSKDEGKPYVIVAVGLDQVIYPGLAMNNDEAKKISQTLQSLLNLKGNIKYSQEDDYQKNFAVGYKR